tara:strand:+ start:91 stop:624 length:534 start_codon:yes stop_codon:yes gene_type:complete
MSLNKTKMDNDNIVTFEKNKVTEKPIFSNGLYSWVMFVISFYTRIREKLNIDFESFIILQVVLSHSLYEANKGGDRTYNELEEHITNIIQNNTAHKNKLTAASIAEVLQMPRETVRRKIMSLKNKNILIVHNTNGIKLGAGYKEIYKDFVSQTTLDISSLIKKWKKSGALESLLNIK